MPHKAKAERRVVLPKYAERITSYVETQFEGKVREAARVIGVDHVTLWRAMHGHAVRGPGADLCEALEKHSGRPMIYWRGRSA